MVGLRLGRAYSVISGIWIITYVSPLQFNKAQAAGFRQI